MNKDNLCIYCGEEEGQTFILNPNFDESEDWWVCFPCKEIINAQQKLSMGMKMKEIDKEHNIESDYLDKIIQESQEDLERIEFETGKKSYSIVLKKRSSKVGEG